MAQTIQLNAGNTLTVTADAASAGNVRRLGQPGTSTTYAPEFLTASTSTTIGPFLAARNYEIVSTSGALTYSVAVSELEIDSITASQISNASAQGLSLLVDGTTATPTFVTVAVGVGSAAAPSIKLRTTSGIYSAATTSLDFSVAGARKFGVDNTGLLDSVFFYSTTQGSAAQPVFFMYDGVGAGGMYSDAAGAIAFATAGGRRFGVNSAGVIDVTSVKVSSYTVAGVPSAATTGAGAMIYVSNETGGGVIAFSDGTNWRRVTDRAIVS